MDDGATVRILGDHTRQAACELVRQTPDGWLVKIGQPPRTLPQSSRFWATCTDVAKSGWTWGGTPHDKAGWHDLFLSGWNITAGRPVRLLIGLQGERVSLVPHTRWMSEADMSDVLDYTSAWCAVRGIAVKE